MRERKGHRLPNSYTSSFKLHELLMHCEDLPNDVLAGFAHWGLCFLVIQFDVDIGPDLKLIRPSIQFSEDEFRTICFSSLPERPANLSKQTTSSSSFHSFQFKSYTLGNQLVYGSCLFTQLKDAANLNSRGYIQESLVLLSFHEYTHGLFKACLKKIIEYENFTSCPVDQKIPSIDNAIANMSQWPPPNKNAQPLVLPFMGSVFNFSFNHHIIDTKADDDGGDSYYSGMAFEDWSDFIPLLKHNTSFQTVTDIIYLLYERLLLECPIVVYSSSPHLCSGFISFLLSIILPIGYQNRVRDYITLQSLPDNDDKLVTGILGTTNPLVLDNIKQHHDEGAVLSIILYQPTQQQTLNNKPSISKFLANQKSLFTAASTGSDLSASTINRLKASNKTLYKARYLIPSPTTKLNDMDEQSIKLHFSSLTSKLLGPLIQFNEYNFDKDRFLSSFDSLSLPTDLFNSTNALYEFYSSFVQTNNFKSWLKNHKQDIYY